MKGTVTVTFELDDCLAEGEVHSDNVGNAHEWIKCMLFDREEMEPEDYIADLASDCATEGLVLRRLVITAADGKQEELYREDD